MKATLDTDIEQQCHMLIGKALALSEVADHPLEFAKRRQAILDEFADLIGHERSTRLAALQDEIDRVRALAGSPLRASISLCDMVGDRIQTNEMLGQLLEAKADRRPDPNS